MAHTDSLRRLQVAGIHVIQGTIVSPTIRTQGMHTQVRLPLPLRSMLGTEIPFSTRHSQGSQALGVARGHRTQLTLPVLTAHCRHSTTHMVDVSIVSYVTNGARTDASASAIQIPSGQTRGNGVQTREPAYPPGGRDPPLSTHPRQSANPVREAVYGRERTVVSSSGEDSHSSRRRRLQ